jgi:fucose 4-O-acetylase-like acetyltransferase
MPLFFFLSGFVFVYDKYSFTTTLKKSIKGLLIPYAFFALLSYVFWISNNNVSSLSFLKVTNHLSGILYGNSSTLFFNDILWFLPCLFAAKICFAYVSKIIKQVRFLILFLVILSISGYLVSVLFPNIKLPFGIESALTAVVFFGFGSIARTRQNAGIFQKLQTAFAKYKYILLPVFGVICYVFATISFNIYGQQADIRLNHINNYFFFYIAAICGVSFTMIVSQIIRKNFALEYIGRNTLVLFALHPLVFFYIKPIISFISSIDLVNSTSAVLLPYLYTCISIGIILCLNFFYKKISLRSLKRSQ